MRLVPSSMKCPHLLIKSRLLVATKGHGRVKHVVTVDPHRPGMEAGGEQVGLAEIFCPNACRQPVHRIIGQGENLLEILNKTANVCSKPSVLKDINRTLEKALHESSVSNLCAFAVQEISKDGTVLAYTQRIVESTIALLKSHIEDTRSLMEQWGQQGDSRVSESYKNLFGAPFTAYQQLLEGVEKATKQNTDSLFNASYNAP
jgi:hypothetical protein